MNRLRQVQALKRWERWVFVKAAMALPITAAALKLFGLKHWQGLMAKTAGRRFPKETTSNSQRAIEAREVARVVSIASRHVYHGNCLQQSLVLWWLLKQRNIRSEIRFGARKETNELAAHAWVECDGLVLNDADNIGHHFAPFNRSPINGPFASTLQQDL